MSATITPGVTVTEKLNEDGSKTVTTVTIHEDGSKSTKRKTIRPKRSTSPKRSVSPKRAVRPTNTNGGSSSMEDALEDALQEEGHKDDESFEKAVRRCIPSEFLLIASQDDLTQAQEAYHASTLFDLPNPKGEAGSVATCALLQYLYKTDGQRLTCHQVVREMQERMKKGTNGKFVLKPQISSSRPLGPPRLGSNNYAPFHICPPGFQGQKRALLIGIKFIDDEESKWLKGSHNDVHNVQQYLKEKCGFSKKDICVLKDKKEQDPAKMPTKINILANFSNLTRVSQPGDVVFIQYSGHGGRVKDLSGDEADGYDSYILPCDYKTQGQILDDDILKDLIKAMPEGVHTTMLVDCCNSGTVGDLPYILKARGDQEIEKFFDTDTRAEILQQEAQGLREAEEYKRAKAERKNKRERKKAQQEKAAATASAQSEKDAAQLAEQLVGLNTASAPVQRTTTAPPRMQTFHIQSEGQVAALTQKYGIALQLSPEQKACLQQGGTVTLSFQTQQPQQMAAPQQQQKGQIMMTPEQAEAFKKANGGKLVMTPEQAAMFRKQQQQ